MRRLTVAVLFGLAGLAGLTWSAVATARPLVTTEGVLPLGSELNEDAVEQPREIFKSEAAGGKRSYLLNLGDMAFSAPSVLGGPARQAGISCNTCHMNGASNARLFIPGMSTRPGNFDTTGPLFFPKADNGLLDPVRVPSLRGARYLAPYGHDGRVASLRQFIRNVIVDEFAGDEPSPELLDGLVTYVTEIDFLPNPRLGLNGHLQGETTAAERRGAALFRQPFRHDAALSCSGCHVPTGAFTDHGRHDVGSGGQFRTPTLRNANFNAPYFHDGRFDTYDEVVAYFDKEFDLGLSKTDQGDLVAYLHAIGDGEQPHIPDTIASDLTEIGDFVSVLDIALPAQDKPVISLTATAVGGELRELSENFPERRNTAVSGGIRERAAARSLLADMVLSLRRIDDAAAGGDYDQATVAYADYQRLAATAPEVLHRAEPYSLFDPDVRIAFDNALRALVKVAQADTH